MIHFSCDRCKRTINPETDVRYVVRMEVRATMELSDGNDGDANGRDHLMELHEILECAEDLESEFIDDEVYQQLKFDLCPECHRKFIKNPVGKESSMEFNFSQN